MPLTLRKVRAQERSPKPPNTGRIQNPYDANALCVPDGQIVASTVVYSDGLHFAFDPFDVLVGEHPLLAVGVTATEAGVS